MYLRSSLHTVPQLLFVGTFGEVIVFKRQFQKSEKG